MAFINNLWVAFQHLDEVPEDSEMNLLIAEVYDFCLKWFGEPKDGDQKAAYIFGFPPGLRWRNGIKRHLTFKYVFSIDYRYNTIEQQLAAVSGMMYERFALPAMTPYLLHLPVVGIMQSRLELQILRLLGYSVYADFLEKRGCDTEYIPLIFKNHSPRILPVFMPIIASYQPGTNNDRLIETKYQQSAKLGHDLEELVGWRNLARIIDSQSLGAWISLQDASLREDINGLFNTVGVV